MRLNEAKQLAKVAGLKLQPFTTRINIAGSIRREKPDVKDIEIICLPKYIDGTQTGLFSDVPPVQVISLNFVETVRSLGKVIKGKPDGRYMQIELPQRINLDLFMPDPDDYFRQYAVRTGSADYAHKTIAAGWKRKGWCGSNMGLRRIVDCEEECDPLTYKGRWICVNPHGEKPPVWKSEQEFFDWIGVPWIMPKLRTI
jgi:DNA polymerase/3'-5' exonuclease PolX